MKFAPLAASEEMYGAFGLPTICVSAWFSSTTTTTWSGCGTTLVAPARAAWPTADGAADSPANSDIAAATSSTRRTFISPPKLPADSGIPLRAGEGLGV